MRLHERASVEKNLKRILLFKVCQRQDLFIFNDPRDHNKMNVKDDDISYIKTTTKKKGGANLLLYSVFLNCFNFLIETSLNESLSFWKDCLKLSFSITLSNIS